MLIRIKDAHIVDPANRRDEIADLWIRDDTIVAAPQDGAQADETVDASGLIAMAGGIGQFVAVTATIWLVGGLGTWLIGSDHVHIGASVLVFGWLVFLLVRGFFARSSAQILLAVALFVIWGGVLWGMLPGAPGISWEGHLFGALGGLIAAQLVARADRPHSDSTRPDPTQAHPDQRWPADS